MFVWMSISLRCKLPLRADEQGCMQTSKHILQSINVIALSSDVREPFPGALSDDKRCPNIHAQVKLAQSFHLAGPCVLY